jgi:lysophospholipase L1-like esterase
MHNQNNMKKIILFTLMIGLQFSFTPKPITWVALGDSITYLNDHQNETGNRITKGYMTMVTEKLKNIQYINKGYNGWTATKIATDIEKLGIQKADIYSIFLGTNDWWGAKPLGTIDDYKNNTGTKTVNGSFRVIVDKLRSLNNQASIVLITPMQRVDFVYINDAKNNAWGSYKEKGGQQLENFANAIVEIGKYEHIKVVDLFHEEGMELAQLVKFKRLKNPVDGAYKNFKYPDFIGIPFNPNTDEYPYPMKSINVTYDGLHPSDKGYKKIAASLINIFRKLN